MPYLVLNFIGSIATYSACLIFLSSCNRNDGAPAHSKAAETPKLGSIPPVGDQIDPKADPLRKVDLASRIRAHGAVDPNGILAEINLHSQGVEKEGNYALLADILSAQSISTAKDLFLNLPPSSFKNAALEVILKRDRPFNPQEYVTRLATDEVSHLRGEIEFGLKTLQISELKSFILSNTTESAPFQLLAGKAYGEVVAEQQGLDALIQATDGLSTEASSQALRYGTSFAASRDAPGTAAYIFQNLSRLDDVIGGQLLASSAGDFSRSRPQDAVSFYLNSAPQNPAAAVPALRAVFSQWAEIDPIGASSAAREIPENSPMRDAAAMSIASYCMNQGDFEAADIWISSIKDSQRQQELAPVLAAKRKARRDVDPSGSVKIGD